MLKSLDNTKSAYISGVKLTLIKRGLIDLKNEIKQVSEDEKRDRRPDAIVNLVKNILDFNDQN